MVSSRRKRQTTPTQPEQGVDPAFVPVPRRYLRRDTIPGFDLYVAAGDRLVLYHAAGAPFDEAAEQRLGEHMHATFYIRAADRDRLRSYLQQDLRAALTSIGPPHELALLLFDATCDAVDAVMANPDDPVPLQTAAGVAVLAMEQVIKEPRVLGAFVSLGQAGTHVYSHAAQSCFFAVALGYRAGMAMDELPALAVAGLLHDVGQARLDPELVRRSPSSFTKVERTMFQRHPVLGAEIVARGHLPAEAALFVRQHHEQPDGAGYPAGVSGGELSLGARVLAVVDAYDDLRNPHDGAPSLSPFHALATMRYRMLARFDRPALMEFVRLLGSIEPAPVSVTVPETIAG